jgi:hypothetical protein
MRRGRERSGSCRQQRPQIGFVLQFRPRAQTAPFRNRACAGPAAGAPPDQDWLRSAISAEDQFGFVLQPRPRRSGRGRAAGPGLASFRNFCRRPIWLRFATTPTSIRPRTRRRTRIGFVPQLLPKTNLASFCNHAHVDPAADAPPDQDWLRSAISAEDQFGFVLQPRPRRSGRGRAAAPGLASFRQKPRGTHPSARPSSRPGLPGRWCRSVSRSFQTYNPTGTR